MAFRIIRDDITKVKADAIVNTANPEVTIGDGVDSAIYEAAGTSALLAARKQIGRLEIGEVGITPAFQLKAKYIIHSSGPYWIDGEHEEAALLRQCYGRALELAHQYKCKSIAFPLMSTGTYGFSKELGLQIALEVFNAFLLRYDMEIILVVFGETSVRLSGQIFDDVKEYVDNAYVEKKLLKEYKHDGRPESAVEELELYETSALPRRNRRRAEVVPTCKSIESKSHSYGCPEWFHSDKIIPEQGEIGTLGEYLQQMINKKGMKNSDVYGKANMNKQYFSRLLNGKVTPSKTKILSLAVALRLNMDETIDFLRMCGYAFSPFSQVDRVFEYFIRHEIYDIYKIDIFLFDYGLPTLANEK